MRRRKAPERMVLPDPKYKSELVSKFINGLTLKGKKSISETILKGILGADKVLIGKLTVLRSFIALRWEGQQIDFPISGQGILERGCRYPGFIIGIKNDKEISTDQWGELVSEFLEYGVAGRD